MAIATPLSTSGRFIVDAHGNRVRLAGVNWYGASENEGVPVGLDVIHRNQLAELIASFGFNCVRLPFSAWMTEQTAPVPGQNEPRPATVGGRLLNPTWGLGDQTDFSVMYTSIGNVIHQLNPHLLIICEGLGYATHLEGVATHPVRLAAANKVVYSMHDYSWFHPQGQTEAAYAQSMNAAGGYLLTEKIAPLWIGEFGDNVSSLAASPGGISWWANIQAWLTDSDVDWCWWALNPVHGNSCDPGTSTPKYTWGQPEPYGLLTSDWANAAYLSVISMLQAMMHPRTGPGVP